MDRYPLTVAGELVTATVVLYDVVDSTRIRTDLGDGEAERLLRDLEQKLAGLVAEHGGEVVKGTGDGQLLLFRSATAALAAACAIQRANSGLALRLGVSAGDVRRTEFDIHGTPAAEVARLCADAQPGERMWRRTLGGATQLAVLAGEPGAGKTRLAVEFARRLATNATLLAGRCERQGSARFGPLLDAMEGHLRVSPTDPGAPDVSAAERILARVMPHLTEQGVEPSPDLEDPSLEEYRLGRAVIDVVSTLARRSPVLMVLDDVQWAGDATRHLLSRMFRSLPSDRVMVILTCRDTADDLDPETSAWLESLRRSHDMSVVSMAGLSQEDVAVLAERALGSVRGGEVQSALFERSGGNGFFASELLRELVIGIPSSVPATVSGLVMERLARLPGDVAELLTAGALLGLEFVAGVAARSVGLDQAATRAAITQAMGARLILEVGFDRYQFAHALITAALEEQLSRSDRARLHRSLAEVLEMDDSDSASVARHLVAAIPAVSADRARNAAVTAAEDALGGVRYDEAARLFGLAVAAAEDDGTHGTSGARNLGQRSVEGQQIDGGPRTPRQGIATSR